MENKNKIGQFFKKDFETLQEQLRRLRQMVGGSPEPETYETDGAPDDYEYDEDAEFNEGIEVDPAPPFAPFIANPSGPSRTFNISGTYSTGYASGPFHLSGYITAYTGSDDGISGSGYRLSLPLPGALTEQETRDIFSNTYVDPKYKKAPKYEKKHHPLTSIFADKKNE